MDYFDLFITLLLLTLHEMQIGSETVADQQQNIKHTFSDPYISAIYIT